MKLPNGYGSVVKLSGKRRKPWMVRKTTGYRIDPIKEKKVKILLIYFLNINSLQGNGVSTDCVAPRGDRWCLFQQKYTF